jgi:hypothetical protein
MVLEQFQDEAHPSTFYLMQANVLQLFPTNFTTKHPQWFSDTHGSTPMTSRDGSISEQI